MDEEIIQEHESFVVAKFSKVSSNGVDCFGSTINHRNYITLRIARAKTEASLSGTHYNKGVDLISVRMTKAQFVELITDTENYTGTPCTLEFLKGSEVPDLPPDRGVADLKELVDNRINNIETEARASIENSIQEIKNSKLSNKLKTELVRNMERSLRLVEHDMLYITKLVYERTDELVSKGRIELNDIFSSLDKEIKNRMSALELIKEGL